MLLILQNDNPAHIGQGLVRSGGARTYGTAAGRSSDGLDRFGAADTSPGHGRENSIGLRRGPSRASVVDVQGTQSHCVTPK